MVTRGARLLDGFCVSNVRVARSGGDGEVCALIAGKESGAACEFTSDTVYIKFLFHRYCRMCRQALIERFHG
jgi:hypothetical protein